MSRTETDVKMKRKNQVPESVMNSGDCLGKALAKPSVILTFKAQLFVSRGVGTGEGRCKLTLKLTRTF